MLLYTPWTSTSPMTRAKRCRVLTPQASNMLLLGRMLSMRALYVAAHKGTDTASCPTWPPVVRVLMHLT